MLELMLWCGATQMVIRYKQVSKLAHNGQALLSLFAALFLLLRPQSQGVMHHPTPFPTQPICIKSSNTGLMY